MIFHSPSEKAINVTLNAYAGEDKDITLLFEVMPSWAMLKIQN